MTTFEERQVQYDALVEAAKMIGLGEPAVATGAAAFYLARSIAENPVSIRQDVWAKIRADLNQMAKTNFEPPKNWRRDDVP